MKTCQEIRQSFREDLSELQATELRSHLANCPACAREYRLVRLERGLLQATLPGDEALELSPHFLAKLRAQWRQAQLGERWAFWEFVWGFSKPFAAIAMGLLILIGGLNLYTAPSEESAPLPMESYLVGTLPDDVDLILSEDVALTQERVLGTLVVIREDDNGNQQ